MKLSRRQMLLSTAAAAGATFFDAPAILGADAYGGFPVGVQSYSLRGFNMLEAVRHIQGMGLHFVEFYPGHVPVTDDAAKIKEVNELLQKAKISMSAHGVHGFGADHAANEKIFAYAKAQGIKCLTANPQKASYESLDKLCEKYKIRIAIHNHGPDALYDKIESVVGACKGRHPLFGACIDTGHFIRSKENPVEAVHRLKGRVFALHVKDEAKQEKQSHNVVIGAGHLDVTGLFQALKDTKFPADGSVSLEYEANPQNPIDDMKECLEVAKECIANVK